MNHLKEYRHLDDSALAKMVAHNDDIAFEVLSARYINLIYSLSHSYLSSLSDYDANDLVQEGLITMLSVCKNYDESRNSSFKNYLMICIENRYKNLIKSANNQKSVPQDKVLRIHEKDVEDMLNKKAVDTTQIVETKDYIKSLMTLFKEVLSPFECRVISLYLSSFSYKEIADKLSISTKAVDNAMQRIRRKLSSIKE